MLILSRSKLHSKEIELQSLYIQSVIFHNAINKAMKFSR